MALGCFRKAEHRHHGWFIRACLKRGHRHRHQHRLLRGAGQGETSGFPLQLGWWFGHRRALLFFPPRRRCAWPWEDAAEEEMEAVDVCVAGCRGGDGGSGCVCGGMRKRRWMQWICLWWDAEEEMDAVDMFVVGCRRGDGCG